jgi:RNA 2',3'-cyclic 3'-phosphodiesterase
MRLFVALLPPPAAVAELAAALAPVRALPEARPLRWAEPAGWHVTVAFLGEVADRRRPDLDERLARAARRHGPYALRLSGAGRFGDRTLWAGAEGDLAGLGRLADSVRAAARRAGQQLAEEHGFRAHLTLARVPGALHADLRPLTEALGGFTGSVWTAGTLSLVSSELPRSGVAGEQPHYTTVAAWPLGAGAQGGDGLGSSRPGGA